MYEILRKSSKIGDRFITISDLHNNGERISFQFENRQLSRKFEEQIYSPLVLKIVLSPGTRILPRFCKYFLKIWICVES